MPTWTCPMCGRRVPARAGRCHCGVTRKEARRVEAARDREREAPPRRRIPSIAVMALVCLGLAFVLRDALSPAPPREDAAPATRPGSRGARPRPPRVPSSPPTAVTTLPGPPGLLAPAQEGPSPEPLPSAAPADEATEDEDGPGVDARREQGLRELERRLDALGPDVAIIEQRLDDYEGQCHTSISALAPRGCDGMLTEIQDARDRLVEGLRAATEAARRSWVEPGSVRRARASRDLSPGRLNDILRRVGRAERSGRVER